MDYFFCCHYDYAVNVYVPKGPFTPRTITTKRTVTILAAVHTNTQLPSGKKGIGI